MGLGAAAASHYGGCRFTVVPDMDKYCSCILSGGGEGLIAEEYDCPLNECVGDYVMLGLRLNEGIVLKDFASRFRGRDFEAMFGDRLAPFVDKGLAVKDEKGYHLTRRGFYVSNYILSSILDFDTEETI